ncbi:hypothetical protein OIT41_02595 [Arthrobacter sp. YA7-1]|nr:hypothetical protein [Arthrobacter sp. YA7-1]UYY81983.1 hypothetical protein OIT41_02595 [Arthrobacter sp. YA7-1]
MKRPYLLIIALAMAGIAGLPYPQQTVATWPAPQYASGSLTAGTVATPAP